jgi:hypothetical protein
VQGAIATFNAGARRFYAEADQLAGGIHGEDRRGNPTFFSFVTMAIGCVRVRPNAGEQRRLHSSETIASAAALAKRRAKQEATGFFVVDVDEVESLTQMNTAAPHAASQTGAQTIS